jgi:hypothetical protein
MNFVAVLESQMGSSPTFGTKALVLIGRGLSRIYPVLIGVSGCI